jgi:hypothetical protein
MRLATVTLGEGIMTTLHAARNIRRIKAKMRAGTTYSHRLRDLNQRETGALVRQLAACFAMALPLVLAAGSCGEIERAVPVPTSPAPYPASREIVGITFDWDTHDRRAPGSDNWPITWAADGHQYTSWGDGGGFGGDNSDGRVSLGVARVEGDATSYTGHNVWGGKDAENVATFDGKSYGIISVDGTLYMWRSPGSGPTGYTRATVYRSGDQGMSWTPADWDFLQSDGLINPTFLQYGRDYAGARDSFVYMYANELKDPSDLKVQLPGEIALLRVPQNAIMDRSQYEFFAGLDSLGAPTWTTDLTRRRPVFQNHTGGVGWNSSASYNPGVGRYFLITEHTATSAGNIGIFDAPEPWGPWTTVLYQSGFGGPAIQASTFFWNFSNKWSSVGGRDFVLVFTGVGRNDSWNSVRGSFVRQ